MSFKKTIKNQKEVKKGMSQPISRVLSRIIIHLDSTSPQNSSNLPCPVRTDIRASIWSCSRRVYNAIYSYLICGALLPHLFTLTYKRRFIFCCTIRRFTSPRSYLASCPMEPGLSSQKNERLSG